MYKKSKRKKRRTNSNEIILNKVANIFTIILSSVNIFYLCYSINSSLYPKTDRILRTYIMIFIQFFLMLLISFFTFISISTIFRSIFIDRKNLKEKKFKVIFKTFIKFIIISILSIENFLGYNFIITFNISKEIIIFYLIISIILTIIVSILSLKLILNPKIEKVRINDNRFYKLIRLLSEYIGVKSISLVVIIFNILFIVLIGFVWENFRVYEESLLIEEKYQENKSIKFDLIVDKIIEKIDMDIAEKEYKRDKSIKLDLIVDRILEKIDIDITKEELENEIERIIDKYINKLEKN